MSGEGIEKHLREKAQEALSKMEYFKDALCGSIFFLGGSAIAASNPNDIDIFFQFREYLDNAIRWVGSRTSPLTGGKIIGGIKKVHDGQNAYTFRCPTSDIPFQFIQRLFSGLGVMIDSFDFAHIQAGVEVIEANGRFEITRVYWTPAYEKSLEIADSWYTGSDNPFSALYRLGKYHAKGELSASSFKTQMIKIVNDIFEWSHEGSEVRRQLSLIGVSDALEEKDADLCLRGQDVDRLIGNLTMIAWFKLFR